MNRSSRGCIGLRYRLFMVENEVALINASPMTLAKIEATTEKHIMNLGFFILLLIVNNWNKNISNAINIAIGETKT